jgi:hypothetical protein
MEAQPFTGTLEVLVGLRPGFKERCGAPLTVTAVRPALEYTGSAEIRHLFHRVTLGAARIKGLRTKPSEMFNSFTALPHPEDTARVE